MCICFNVSPNLRKQKVGRMKFPFIFLLFLIHNFCKSKILPQTVLAPPVTFFQVCPATTGLVNVLRLEHTITLPTLRPWPEHHHPKSVPSPSNLTTVCLLKLSFIVQ